MLPPPEIRGNDGRLKPGKLMSTLRQVLLKKKNLIRSRAEMFPDKTCAMSRAMP